MANPFLVLGGVAVGVITAGIGVLAVPGWIDNANDSAAMNDLGSIRGAESAAILMLGSYTDDFDVLESGELGVKFQKSDGVTLIGLKADSNESWCASVQSKSGKFFAASNVQAAIATAPGAEAAMEHANCAPDLVAEIIADAGTADNPEGRPVDVGVEGPGSWVGGGGNPAEGAPGSGGDSGGGSGTPFGDCLASDTSVPPAATLGAAVNLEGSAVVDVAWTPAGVFAVTEHLDHPIVQLGPDGQAHAVTMTGYADTDSWFRPSFPIGKITGDGYGNLYVASTGGPTKSLVKLTPDHVTTLVKSWSYEDGQYVYPAVSKSGTLYFAHDGAVSRCNPDGSATLLATIPDVTYQSEPVADDLGNVYVSDANNLWVVNDTGARKIDVTDEWGNKVFTNTLAVTTDGKLYTSGSGTGIYLIDTDNGTVTQHADPAGAGVPDTLGSVKLMGTADDGTLYFQPTFSNDIWTLSPDGEYTRVLVTE